MITNHQVKYIRSLAEKKFRYEYRKSIAEGEKIVEELILSGNIEMISELYATSSWIDSNYRLIKLLQGKEIIKIEENELKKISQLHTPNKVLAVIKIEPKDEKDIQREADVCLYFDKLQDPGNMGTIIRTADWFGIKQLYCSPDSVEVFSPKVIQSSMGSVFRVEFVSIDFERLMSILENNEEKIRVYGTSMEGENILENNINKPGIVVFGNESRGISSHIKERVTDFITIPKRNKSENSPESLNVGIAMGIICSRL